jgi:SAM-dependent methyltransferase
MNNPNTYSATWYEVFATSVPSAQTESEARFIARHIPRPASRVLDLACGLGRHAHALADLGYRVVGLDINPVALDLARAAGGNVDYILGDMRVLDSVPGEFDAVICLWQSFGYFDASTNLAVLAQIHHKLLPDGRLILDLFHRGFFERHVGRHEFTRSGVTISELKQIRGDRLVVTLEYGPDRDVDRFDWHIYSLREITEIVERRGFALITACRGFDEAVPPSDDYPRMQLIFAKTNAGTGTA